MNLRDLAIGVILISGVLLGATMMYSEMFISYGINETSANATSFSSSTLNKMYNKTQSIQSSLNQTQPAGQLEQLDILGNFANNVINAFFIIMDLPAIAVDMVNNGFIALGLPIPMFITQIIFTIIVIFVLFEILSGVLKWRL